MYESRKPQPLPRIHFFRRWSATATCVHHRTGCRNIQANDVSIGGTMLISLTEPVFLWLSGVLTRESSDHLLRRMEALAAEFRDLKQQDMGLPVPQRSSTTLVMAAREWRPRAFSRLLAEDRQRRRGGERGNEP